MNKNENIIHGYKSAIISDTVPVLSVKNDGENSKK